MKVLLRGLIVLVALLAVAPVAEARGAACPVKVSSVSGAAPLRVTFHAKCASPVYTLAVRRRHDGHGRTVTHTFARRPLLAGADDEVRPHASSRRSRRWR